MSLVTVNKSLLITCVQLALSSKRCTSQFHLLLIVLMKETHLYDAFDPLLVERHIGVPPREPFPTSQTSCSTRTREDEMNNPCIEILPDTMPMRVCLPSMSSAVSGPPLSPLQDPEKIPSSFMIPWEKTWIYLAKVHRRKFYIPGHTGTPCWAPMGDQCTAASPQFSCLGRWRCWSGTGCSTPR